MPAITNDEKARRLVEIKRLQDDDKTPYQISESLGLPIQTVKREIKYLEVLGRGDITPEDLAQKRSELYLELVEATEEARKLFEQYKNPTVCPICDGDGFKEIDTPFTKAGITYDRGEKYPCVQCKGFGIVHKTVDADRFFKAWVETIEKKAALFGLDNVKSDGLTVNQQFNSLDMTGIEKVTGKTAEYMSKVAKSIIDQHEDKVRNK